MFHFKPYLHDYVYLACLTEDGHMCRFPFAYSNLTYVGCITADDVNPWCYSYAGWGYCDQSCPIAGGSIFIAKKNKPF